MIDLEQLREALAYLTKEFGPSANWPEGDPEWVEYRPLAAAARELLAGQKIWWCQEHPSGMAGYDTAPKDGCDFRLLRDARGWYCTPCRMVEALLVIPE